VIGVALVRCSCISLVVPAEAGLRQQVVVPDPDCDYVVHRLAAGEVR
jgi:hypothetical protein